MKNLVGETYYQLTVLREGPRKGKERRWFCACTCGKETLAFMCALRSGNTKSCGCRRGESHGMCRKRGKSRKEYQAWSHMKNRCYNKNDSRYKSHGARGIKVCDEWLKSFTSFFNHIGSAPTKKHTVDRINNDGHYEPGNVRWATYAEQANNTRKTIKLSMPNGTLMTLSEVHRRTGIKRARLNALYKIHGGELASMMAIIIYPSLVCTETTAQALPLNEN